MGLLVLLSNVPWSDLTGNYIKDFNLLSDICPKQKDLKQTAETAVPEIPEQPLPYHILPFNGGYLHPIS